MPLRVSACRTLCDWSATPSAYDDCKVFACRGCGSQWVRTEPWTPRQADGSWPPGVREEVTGAPDGAGAGSAGS